MPKNAKIDPRAYQVGGTHYQGKAMQPWDIIEAWNLDYWEGNALKYLLRRKPGTKRIEDLQKAIHYIRYSLNRRPDRKRAKQLRRAARALLECVRIVALQTAAQRQEGQQVSASK